ncbi:MAG: DUF1264 domain-containing protein [Nitrosopumilus sp.]|nr:DUF1264 domain-containing protein [Nitrosopumilus sp.]MDH3488376.1 DUF1264 domain-containing protein [Nitrosopumilus sp.]
MNKQLTVVFSMAILLTVTVVASIDLSQAADAVKSKGNSLTDIGSSKVCGDRLCSEIPAEERKTMTKSSTNTSINIDSIFDRMDSVHKKHQSEMKQMWKSMTAQEQSKMFQNMEQMMEKMESMNISEHMKMMEKMMMGKEPVYNETLNPRQIDYPNVLGFNDLHIHANRHLDVNQSHGTAEHLLQTIVHHHCKAYDDNTATCLLFPYGMTDQDKPYGIEYVITTDQYQELPEDEKPYWHYHKTEFPRADAAFPELSDEELAKIQPVLDETYGKVYYFWNYGDTYPMGEPYILVVQEIPDQ